MVTGSLLMEKGGIRTLAQSVCVIMVAGSVHKRAAPLLNVKIMYLEAGSIHVQVSDQCCERKTVHNQWTYSTKR